MRSGRHLRERRRRRNPNWEGAEAIPPPPNSKSLLLRKCERSASPRSRSEGARRGRDERGGEGKRSATLLYSPLPNLNLCSPTLHSAGEICNWYKFLTRVKYTVRPGDMDTWRVFSGGVKVSYDRNCRLGPLKSERQSDRGGDRSG